jgi:hypothetical protein
MLATRIALSRNFHFGFPVRGQSTPNEFDGAGFLGLLHCEHVRDFADAQSRAARGLCGEMRELNQLNQETKSGTKELNQN